MNCEIRSMFRISIFGFRASVLYYHSMPPRVLTFGTFDHFHEGHRAYLSFAAKQGELFVIIARDANVQHIKGQGSDHSEDDRLQAVQEAFPGATVQLGDPDDYMQPIRDIGPDIIVLGYDQRMPPGLTEEALECKILRAEPHQPDTFKTSKIRKNS